MTPVGPIGRAAGSIARRPWVPLIVLAVTVVASGYALVGMRVQPVTEALFDRDTPAWAATERSEESFGGDPLVVVARGDLDRTLEPDALDRLSVLETCLSGVIRRGRGELFELCRQINELDPVEVFAGPATFLGRAAAGIGAVYDRQMKRLRSLPRSPEKAAERRRLLSQIVQIAARYGLTEPPSLQDRTFVNRVVFGSGGVRAGPKPRLAYLFPSRESAQIVIRPRPGLTDSGQRDFVRLVRQVTEHPDTQIEGVEYLVTGSPAVFSELDGAIRIGVLVVVLTALVLMSVALVIVFGSSFRLLPLLSAAVSVLVCFGLLRLIGGQLSLAALGAAPILVGLAVDYAVQLQARFDEMPESLGKVEAAVRSADLSVPMILTACLATAAGFASLYLTDFPLVSEFGLMLGAGLLVSFVVCFLMAFALLSIRGRAPVEKPWGLSRIPLDRAAGLASRFGDLSVTAPWRILAIGILVAAAGWLASTGVRSATDIGELLPARDGAVKAQQEAEKATGQTGEVDLVVRGPDVTRPEVVAWLDRIRKQILEKAGYLGETASCEGAELCPGPSIPDFIPTADGGLDRQAIRAGLKSLSPEDRRAIIAGGKVGSGPVGETRLPFSVRSSSVEGQSEAIDLIRDAVERDERSGLIPDGYRAEVAGLPVIISESLETLTDARYLLIMVAMVAIALVLLIAFRSWRRALLALAPIPIAVGWSSLATAFLGLPLNPLSVVLAVMVIAITAEFSVILSARYRQERRAGLDTRSGLATTYGRTGAAVLASGVTAIAGFAALGASDVGILREFGLIAVIDLGIALAGIALFLPAVLVLGDREP